MYENAELFENGKFRLLGPIYNKINTVGNIHLLTWWSNVKHVCWKNFVAAPCTTFLHADTQLENKQGYNNVYKYTSIFMFLANWFSLK